MIYLWIICSILSLAALWGLFECFLVVLWRPYVVTTKFQRQGVTGPPYKWVTGCGKEVRRMKEAALKTVLDTRNHDYNPRIFPHHVQWSSRYGGTYLFWSGTEPWIVISDVEMMKQSNKFGFFTKGTIRPTTRALLGNGLVLTEGVDSVRHRRVLNPAFHTEKLKERLRDEVIAECGRDIPTADTVGNLKFVTMLVLETLRLYNPIVMTKREAVTDVKLGNLMIPRGTTLMIPISVLHRNKDVWGAYVNVFNPLRFESGISKASNHPNGLLSFSLGPRICIGQNFALLEAKIVIVMVLQKFSLSLSLEYKHAPRDILTLKPEFGLPITVKTLNA